ncbi:MAG: hypothetical protein MK137_06195 [Rickettsiales bacterium]|nr:hypothetical protein [Rickettsiales bacterium]
MGQSHSKKILTSTLSSAAKHSSKSSSKSLSATEQMSLVYSPGTTLEELRRPVEQANRFPKPQQTALERAQQSCKNDSSPFRS